MKASVRGRDALARYLNHEWTFDQLYDWAITFWDQPDNRSDEKSRAIAGHVLEWIWELGDAVPTIEEFNAEMTSLANSPTEFIAHRS